MATLIDDGNPSGIIFDNPGPGAGLKAPGVPKAADRIAQVAAKAKTTPATKVASKTTAPAATKVIKNAAGKKVKHTVLTIEDYKATGVDDLIYSQGGVVLGFSISTRTQNAHDYLVEFPA